MRNKILSIDFEIIWKSIHASLNEDEQLLLDNWLAEDQKHRKYYHKVVSHYKKEDLDVAEANIKSIWKEIRKEKAAGPGNMRIMISIAASIVLIIATLLIFLKTPTGNSSDTQIAQNQVSNIVPGQKKAILHLGNGESILLGSGKSVNTQTGGAAINITDESVRYNEEKNTSATSVEMHEIEVPKGGEFMLILSDSTKVWLNSESTLRYPSVFDKAKRVVELTGEAYFEVTYRSNQQFNVITADQTITVLGTTFNVNYYPENKEVVSTLVEGKVRISTTEGSNTVLSPGEQAVYNKENKALTRQKVNVENFIAWKNGLFYFENESLERIMIRLSRWYDIEVVYKDPDLKKLRYTGTLKKYDSLKSVIDLIEMTNDVKFNIKDNLITIE